MMEQISERDYRVIEILGHESNVGLHPVVPTKAVATALNIPEHEAEKIFEDLRSRMLVSPQSDVLDGRDDPANHKWIWVKGFAFKEN